MSVGERLSVYPKERAPVGERVSVYPKERAPVGERAGMYPKETAPRVSGLRQVEDHWFVLLDVAPKESGTLTAHENKGCIFLYKHCFVESVNSICVDFSFDVMQDI